MDELLITETKAECTKYGIVQDCRIFVVTRDLPSWQQQFPGLPDSEGVRTFVRFDTQSSAVQAYRDLNGRYFARRQVMASFFDEAKFLRGELAPVEGEW